MDGPGIPGLPVERYADDIIAHCDSEDQARQLLAAIAARLGALGLELHPGKTKIVFCKDANRRGTSSTPASISSATPTGAAWPRGQEAISLASPRLSAPRRRKRKASRSGTGTSTAAVARTCSAWPGRSIPRSRAGSTITGPSTAPSCVSWHGASTSTSPGGPCTNSNDSAVSTPERWTGCRRCISTSHACSPTGSSSRSPKAGLWGPDDGRPSRPVLRAAVEFPADSPGSDLCAAGQWLRAESDDSAAKTVSELAMLRLAWPGDGSGASSSHLHRRSFIHTDVRAPGSAARQWPGRPGPRPGQRRLAAGRRTRPRSCRRHSGPG